MDELGDKSEGGAELLFTMKIEIGDGRAGDLRVLSGAKATELAKEFAARHTLSGALEKDLVFLIEQQQKLLESKEAQKRNRNSKCSFNSQDKTRTSTRQEGRAPTPRKQTRTPLVNYGTVLHAKPLKRRQATAGTQDRNCTFSPKVNPFSEERHQRVEDVLLGQGNFYTSHLEQLQASQREQEATKCSFTPKILRSPKRSSAVPRHELLHQHSKTLQLKKSLIRELAHSAFKKTPRTVTPEAQERSASRLSTTNVQLQEKIGEMRASSLSRELSHNDKPLFRPGTGRSPSTPRLSEGQKVHDYLYSKRNNRVLHRKYMSQAQLILLESQAAEPKASDHSRRIYDRYRGKLYAKLFHALDSDCDGKIAANAIELNALPADKLQVLAPVLALVDKGEKLDIASFVRSMEDVWFTISVEERGKLLKRGVKGVYLPQAGFVIDPRSEELAEKVRKLLGGDVYTRSVSLKNLKTLKVGKLKEIQEEEEMKECSFWPKTNQKAK